MDIFISAPGKVILHGEHAVVYGKAAVAASLDLRSFLRMTKTDDENVVIDLPDIGIYRSWKISQIKNCMSQTCKPDTMPSPTEDVLQQLRCFAGLKDEGISTKDLAVVAFLYLYHSISSYSGTFLPLKIQFSSCLPVSAGLGSSAGYSVNLAAGLLLLVDMIKQPKPSQPLLTHQTWSMEENEVINRWAFLAEKIIHGNPSGIDNSVATFGGALKFQKGEITPLKSMPKLRVLLTNTRVPRSTKVLVAGVRDKYDAYPDVMQPVMDSVAAISEECQNIFTRLKSDEKNAECYKSLEELIDINQNHLRIMGVSHPALDTICQVSAKYKLHSKLTGAGGGGCGFTLVPPGTSSEDVQSVMLEMENHGYDCFETSIGGLGVCFHHEIDDSFMLPTNFKKN
ncbi:hypothetical protein ScPMuIL_005873 [Solemya velum]